MPAPFRPSPASAESDSDGSYDSEEESFAARQATARQASAAAAQRRAQADLLAAYRAQQQAREALQRDALAAKLQAQWGLGGSGAWDAHSEAAWQQHEAWCAGSGAHPSRAWLRALQQHEGRWAALAAAASNDAGGDSSGGDSCSSARGSAAGITYAQVPWPPLECEDYLLALAAWEEQQHSAPGQQQQQQQGQQVQQAQQQQRADGPTSASQAAQRAQRRAYARACLRWHPDKFVARWGALLEPADRDRILERVQALSQGLNEAWEALQQRAAGGGEG